MPDAEDRLLWPGVDLTGIMLAGHPTNLEYQTHTSIDLNYLLGTIYLVFFSCLYLWNMYKFYRCFCMPKKGWGRVKNRLLYVVNDKILSYYCTVRQSLHLHTTTQNDPRKAERKLMKGLHFI